MNVLMEFDQVTKKYHEKTVVNSFSFSLRKGEVVALLGPSGCGKTTILNMAAGLANPFSGKVHRHSDKIGYVFQEPRLIPWKTVLDNVLFVMKKTPDRKEKALQSLAKVGLEHAVDYYPRELSGGMKQRVSIARALASDAEILLMDEPFSALDLSLKTELQEDFISIIDDKKLGIIYVTHDAREAAKMADRVILLGDNYCEIKKEWVFHCERCKRSEAYIEQKCIEVCDGLIGGERQS